MSYFTFFKVLQKYRTFSTLKKVKKNNFFPENVTFVFLKCVLNNVGVRKTSGCLVLHRVVAEGLV